MAWVRSLKPSLHGSRGTVAWGMRLYRLERLSCGPSAKMDGATARIGSSDKGRSERSTGERGAKRNASCMVVRPTKRGLLRTPDS